MKIEETYLGDGLFVSYDGERITVRAEGQRVTLEPMLWYALIACIEQLKRAA